MLKTTRTGDGNWLVKGLPFVIGKSPHAPRWGERQEWCIFDPGDNLLGAGYWSKAAALDALEAIGKGFGAVT